LVILKGPTGIEPTVDPANPPPEWWTNAILAIRPWVVEWSLSDEVRVKRAPPDDEA
jgi:hypothetical protein